MGNRDRRSYPAGRPPWDAWNGARIGLLAGGLTGVLVIAFSGTGSYWVALITAAVGGLIGYRTERRKRDDPRGRASP